MKIYANLCKTLASFEFCLTVKSRIFTFCSLDHPVANVPKCYRCENANAEHWCDGDCKHSFCSRCWDIIHEAGQYRNHRKISVKDKPLEMPACKDHSPEDEKGKYWCEGCEKEICGNCQQLKHDGHKVVIITDIINDIEQQVSFFVVDINC